MKLRYVVSVASVLSAVLSFNGLQEARANVADDLNANYNKIVDNCGGANSPAYECSGNLIRLTGPASGYHVWDPSPNSIRTRKISTTFLRHDISVNVGFEGKLSGIIYYPLMSKPLFKDNADVACAFPIDGYTNNGRPDGCGRPDNSKRCQDLGVYTAEEWLNYFKSLIPDAAYNYQCSFDMSNGRENKAQSFNEVLKVARQIYSESGYPSSTNLPQDAINKYNELLVQLWPLNVSDKIANPDKLPIQAFFYLEREGKNGLAEAQSFQKDYYEQTGVVVPIVKMNVGDPANISFSYNADDRGVTVADELNANYNKVVDNCGSKNDPAFECSGVLFRIISNPGSNYHAWDPSQKSITNNGLSFAYLRKDVQFTNFLNANRNSGFIYYLSQQTPSEVDETKVSCAFPVTGLSDNRPYGRCGGTLSYPQASVECQQQGINTADEWYKHFTTPGVDVYNHQCGFDVSNCGHGTADGFAQFIKAHNMTANYGSNEVIIRTAETDINGKTVNPEKLPLQAFFYINATGLTEAKSYQQDYYKTTGKVVPVVYMNISNKSNITFEYKAAYQAVNKGESIAKELTDNYSKVVDNCGSENDPAFACSGNIIRFTNYSTQYHVWDPSPNSIKTGGVSFMYARKDISTTLSFGSNASGILYYPSLLMPSLKGVAEITCAFPSDGWTDRRSEGGCGATPAFPEESKPCQDQGITTADAWYKHFKLNNYPDSSANILQHQCGFKTAIGTKDRASAFNAMLEAERMLYNYKSNAYYYNELIIKTWPTNADGKIPNPEALPIQAFFYMLKGTNSGLTNAQYFQQDYYKVTGIWIPVVKITVNDPQNITYSYSAADQLVGESN